MGGDRQTNTLLLILSRIFLIFVLISRVLEHLWAVIDKKSLIPLNSLAYFVFIFMFYLQGSGASVGSDRQGLLPEPTHKKTSLLLILSRIFFFWRGGGGGYHGSGTPVDSDQPKKTSLL